MIHAASRVLAPYMLSCVLASAAVADPIVINSGSHATVDSEVPEIEMEYDSSLTVNDGAVINSITGSGENSIVVNGGQIGDSTQLGGGGWHYLEINGGDIDSLYMEGGDISISGGNVGNAWLSDAYGSITGGTFDGETGTPDGDWPCSYTGMCFYLDSLVTISGGLFNTTIGLDLLQPNLDEGFFSYGLIFEGYDLELTPFLFGEDSDTGGWTGYQITGTLLDGTPIDTSIYGLREWSGLPTFSGGVNEVMLRNVPEPGSAILFLIGLLGLWVRRANC